MTIKGGVKTVIREFGKTRDDPQFGVIEVFGHVSRLAPSKHPNSLD
jgi:hypothetical protein